MVKTISDACMLGNGNPQEERMVDAATAFIIRTIGFYSTGDRRFAIGLFNTMLSAAESNAVWASEPEPDTGEI